MILKYKTINLTRSLKRPSQSNTMTQLKLIVACAHKGVIGYQGAMPWHIPQELQHFKRLTMGCPVIMGRKTWDSILHSLGKPLPGRQSIVVTRSPDWQALGAVAVHTVPSAIAACGLAPVAWVVGGAQLYAQALPFVDECHITRIDASFEGDAWFPELNPAQWLLADVSQKMFSTTGDLDIVYAYHRYQKR
jgi:dihydrofolate reductase